MDPLRASRPVWSLRFGAPDDTYYYLYSVGVMSLTAREKKVLSL